MFSGWLGASPDCAKSGLAWHSAEDRLIHIYFVLKDVVFCVMLRPDVGGMFVCAAAQVKSESTAIGNGPTFKEK